MVKSTKRINDGFSDRTKEMIGLSGEIAIELGYDYISTIHILLADCKNDYGYSIKNFAFKDNFTFTSFYQNQQIGNSSILQETLPLTLEAEKTVRLAVQLWHRTYIDNEIQPYHLFLAAANLKNTLFRSSFEKQDRLYKELEKYYIAIGTIEEKNIHHSFLKKLFHK